MLDKNVFYGFFHYLYKNTRNGKDNYLIILGMCTVLNKRGIKKAKKVASLKKTVYRR